MYAIAIKSNVSNVQKIELSYEEVLNTVSKRAEMYDLEYVIAKSIELRKINFEALALRPLYLKYIKLKESIYGPTNLWSMELIEQIDNEFVNKYLL